MGELLSGLEGHREVGALRKRLTRGEGKKNKLLQPPLPKPQAERVRREEEVGERRRWEKRERRKESVGMGGKRREQKTKRAVS